MARIVRALRPLHRVPGWGRVANRLIGPDATGAFEVENQTGRFAGDLSSFIERKVYLFGGYEEDQIAAFLALVPPDRRRTILDIGANVGTHSVAFARHFAEVHAFEPNPALWARFDRNIQANELTHVRLHRLALGERDGELPFFTTSNSNAGLGTLSTVEQYDLPLRAAGSAKVARGDRYLDAEGIGAIDAIKVDVQGFEPEVLRGLAAVLARDLPIVWFEVGTGTATSVGTRDAAKALFPFECRFLRFQPPNGLFRRSSCLVPAADELVPGEYIAVPQGQAGGMIPS